MLLTQTETLAEYPAIARVFEHRHTSKGTVPTVGAIRVRPRNKNQPKFLPTQVDFLPSYEGYQRENIYGHRSVFIADSLIGHRMSSTSRMGRLMMILLC